jgi:carbon-monoxide dehydrogenase medium subunit
MSRVKPSPFAYHRPETLVDALGLLAAHGADGKVLAGGQSLLPILSMRLAAPAHLVDINRLPGLDHVTSGSDGVRIGALARHAQVERDPDAAVTLPLLRQALRLVAHPTIRNRGTTVGSLVHADPSGELPAVLVLTGGRVAAASASGRRWIEAADFLAGPMESTLHPDELAVEVFFPALPPGTGTAFVEVSRRHGDYAVCGVTAAVGVERGRVTTARVACISVGPRPTVIDLAPWVAGDGEPDWVAAADAVRSAIDPDGDIHATADYRRHLAGVLAERALASAFRHARAGDPAVAEVG